MIPRAPRSLGVAILALLALVFAGCGGGGEAGVSSESGATVLRSDVLAFVSIDSDLGSDQWQQFDDLAKKFPGRDKAISKLKQSIQREGVDYDQDVKPALGPEVDIAVVSGGTEESTTAVALTKPDDPDKLKALIAKLNRSETGGTQAVYREVDGWYVVSDSQTAITRAVKDGGTALVDASNFKDAMAELPDDALAKAYVDGPKLNELVRRAAAQNTPALDASALGLDTLDFVSASLAAESEGLRLKGASKGGNLAGSTFASKLFGGVPGDAFAFLAFRGGETVDQLEKLESNPEVRQSLQQLQASLGVSYDDILALLRNEVAFYARPGAGIPELTLALETKDPASALATLDKLAARLAQSTGGQVQEGQQGGHTVKTINFGQFAVHYGQLGDDKVLITSGVSGIADYGTSGEQLPDSADFKQAKEAAGMPDSTGGFAYIDLKDAIPLIEGFAGLSGNSLPSDVTENLRPLRSFLAWTAGSDQSRTFDAFLEIK